jgi:hypothetical protein
MYQIRVLILERFFGYREPVSVAPLTLHDATKQRGSYESFGRVDALSWRKIVVRLTALGMCLDAFRVLDGCSPAQMDGRMGRGSP